MEKSEEELLFYVPKRTIFNHLKRSLRRTCLVYVNPFKLFEELSVTPDFLGPLIIISLIIVISLLEGYFWYSKVDIMCYNGTRISLGSRYFSQIATIASLRILGVVMRWFIAFGIFWIISSLLKGQGEHSSLFSATGYLFAVYLLHMTIDTLHLLLFMDSMPTLKVHMPYSILLSERLRESLLSNMISSWMKGGPWPLNTIRMYYAWFFSLWNIVVCFAIYLSERKLSPLRALVASLATYFLIMFAEIFLVQPLFI
ncbi:MAG: hypothetical protein DRJ52_00025 [Thermoprotei archaeon]|nr:MAG: hypothetical protein DRJ52_00025 [Thermoprotei archaeon]RLE98874.1 MAG: hypothetical protein DRJ63_06910 [Thermoprotei archaeon]HDI74753.1 hypothetical protein [Thermoprotei archaeon]